MHTCIWKWIHKCFSVFRNIFIYTRAFEQSSRLFLKHIKFSENRNVVLLQIWEVYWSVKFFKARWKVLIGKVWPHFNVSRVCQKTQQQRLQWGCVWARLTGADRTITTPSSSTWPVRDVGGCRVRPRCLLGSVRTTSGCSDSQSRRWRSCMLATDQTTPMVWVTL